MARRTTTPENQTTEDLEREARKRVREFRDFYVHLATYVVVNLFLIALNLITSPEYLWALFPLLGWGIGLGSHAVSVFGLFGIWNKEWEERKVREYVLQRQSGLSDAEIRQLLHDEMQASRQALPTPTEWERLQQRLEHLEAIVTSEDWDRLHDPLLAATPEPELSLPEEDEAPFQHAARLARRIR
ncbi:MAG TPA: 2TM domain-containing protein [Rhodothermales bacterium]|nr:2TM domain-containing protein [Rhodothermales bacterium]